MFPRLVLTMAVLLFPLGCELQAADLTVSEVQTREWTQKIPRPDGPRIFNSDKFVDYKRNGRLVYRKIVRKQATAFPPDFKKVFRDDVEQHSLEFVADGKVVATVMFDQTKVLSWLINSGGPVYLTALGSNGRSVIQVCIPQADYFEYLELNGTEVKPSPQSGDAYTQGKRAIIEEAAQGHIHLLEKEAMLEQEKK
jgi:hypothetical protein